MSFIAAGIGAAVSIGGSIFGASKAKKAERRARKQKQALQRELKAAEDSL
jgi:hypothetical protein